MSDTGALAAPARIAAGASRRCRASGAHRATRTVGVIAAAALLAGIGASRASAADAVAFGSVDRLVQSTGNLYWTAHEFDGQHNRLSVWRTAKTASPGQETQLWQENAGPHDSFGAITYANVAGTWYGYFVANSWTGTLGGPQNQVSVIKRVPLTGGTATALTTSRLGPLGGDQLPAVAGQNDLLADGSSLYWADAQAIRRMPIAGGAVVTLATGTALGHLALDAGYVYYTAGTTVRRVPKAGGAATTLEQQNPSAITALAVAPGATINNPTTIYWTWTASDGRGIIDSRNLAGGATRLFYVSPQTSESFTTLSTSGNRVFLSMCPSQLVQCFVGSKATDADPGDNPAGQWVYAPPRDVQGDANTIYWADSTGIQRLL